MKATTGQEQLEREHYCTRVSSCVDKQKTEGTSELNSGLTLSVQVDVFSMNDDLPLLSLSACIKELCMIIQTAEATRLSLLCRISSHAMYHTW